MKSSIKILIIFCMTALIFLMYFIFSYFIASKTTLQRIRNTGVVRIGYSNEIPLGYSKPNGEITGESPEVARKIFAKMGIFKMEGVFTEFGSLISDLKAGRFDVIAAGMFITPKRCQEISFSEPTFVIGEAFLVKAGNPKNLHSFEDVVKKENAVICVMEGAVEGKYASMLGIPASRILIVPDTPTGLAAIKSGSADALALTSVSIQKLLDNTNDLDIERAFPFYDPVIEGKEIMGIGAFGFRKEDRELLFEFNKHLKTFIGTEDHQNTVEPFGFNKFPGSATTADFCKGN